MPQHHRRQRPLRPGRCAHQAGFSLLEVLVAFAILSITLGVLMQIFSRAMNTTSISGSFARGAELAEATLARAGSEIPLEQGDSTGEAEAGYTWSLRITQVDVADIFLDQAPPVTPYRVTATAYWQDGSVERRFSLATLRLGDALETAGLGADATVRAPRKQALASTGLGQR